jgi:adenosylmethionine-8-amino-7-oxononanoate aminotransferase
LVDLHQRDLAVLWHPATHFDDTREQPPIAIDRAEGVWLHTSDGRAILDGISSWWTSVHGHGHPAIVAAVRAQVERLDHVMFAGFTHAPAIELAEGLVRAAALGPTPYAKVFFAESGSDAIEVALKLAFQFHGNALGDARGARKRRFATFERGYHGETLGALALCGSELYRAPFESLLHPALVLPAPTFGAHEHHDLDGDAGADAPETARAVAMIEAHADELAAIVIEPVIQCAGQFAMPGVGFYRRVVEAAQRCGVLVIADEIAVGFGRTGRLFASAWSGVAPDLLCLGKGLSGGALPLSAVLVRAGLEDAFTGAPAKAFAHSHTFCANPIACAAARASLALFTDGDALAGLPARIADMTARRRDVAAACPAVVRHRQAGLVAAFDVAPRTRTPPGGRTSLAVRTAALARGVLLRPLGDTIYWMPPLSIDAPALARLADVTVAVIDEVLG